MNRNALLIYLHDLRDLEVAKYRITKMIKDNASMRERSIQDLQYQINQAKKEKYIRLPEGDFGGHIIAGIIATGLSVWGLKWCISLRYPWNTLLGIPLGMAGIVILILGIIWLMQGLIRCIVYKINLSDAKEYNKKEKERLENRVPYIVKEKSERQRELKNTYNLKENHLKKELQKVTELLDEAYGYNILANTYRNLASVYYIYDYMSTSQTTFEDTLMHEHMENGIKRIENKLNVIIEQNEQIIFSVRQTEANTRKTIEQTKETLAMLQKSLELQERTEQTMVEAAQYAAISATYNRTTAFFSTADFLTKNF